MTRIGCGRPARRGSRGNSGFTLLEVMVVVVILGILATVLVTQITGRIGIAQREATKAQIKQIESAVEEFKLLGRRYPENPEELLRKPGDFRGTWPDNGFLRGGDSAILDPWGKEFVYRKNPSGSERRIEIISLGADSQEGGEGEDEDIKNWEDKKNR